MPFYAFIMFPEIVWVGKFKILYKEFKIFQFYWGTRRADFYVTIKGDKNCLCHELKIVIIYVLLYYPL